MIRLALYVVTLMPAIASGQSTVATHSTVEVWSIAASIVSIILAVLAIFLSVYFYSRGKDTERDTYKALAEIKQQADTLQKLSSRQLDRWTRYATEQRPAALEAQLAQVLTVLQQMPTTLTASFTLLQPSQSNQQAVYKEALSGYLGLLFYTAQCNYWAQWYLPPAAEFDEDNEVHAMARRVVDMSAADFNRMASILAACNQEDLKNNPLFHLIETTRHWAAGVKDSAGVFLSREKQSVG